MKIWKYKDKWYNSQKVDWESLNCNPEDISALKKAIEKQFPNLVLANGSFLLYVPKVDKCYYAASISKYGSDNKTRFIMSDAYTRMWAWEYPENVELVVRSEEWIDASKIQPTHIEWKLSPSSTDREKYRLQTDLYDLLFNQEVKMSMKRFSIEEYKKNPDRKVVYGLTKQTPVRIVCIDCVGKQPVVALRQVKDAVGVIREIAYYFTAYGESYINCSEEESLYFVPQKVRKYTIYNKETHSMYYDTFNSTFEAAYYLNVHYTPEEISSYQIVSFDVEE